MSPADYNSTASVVAQGGVSATALVFLTDCAMKMVPYLACCIPLIILDLYWGVRAARHRYNNGSVADRPRFSKGIRKTVGKVFEYLCWCILASTLSLAFHQNWIEWVVLGIVFLNEFASIVGNYLETRDLQISWKEVFKLLFKIGGDKIGTDLSGVDPSSLVKPKEEEK